MVDYKEYINKMKMMSGKPDFDQLYSRIKRKAARPKVRLALAGALAVLLIVFGIYFGYQSQQPSNGGLLMSYVFEEEPVNGEILTYVFANGTFFE